MQEPPESPPPRLPYSVGRTIYHTLLQASVLGITVPLPASIFPPVSADGYFSGLQWYVLACLIDLIANTTRDHVATRPRPCLSIFGRTSAGGVVGRGVGGSVGETASQAAATRWFGVQHGDM